MVVHYREAMRKSDQESSKTKTTGMPRASVSFPPELYETLQELAKKKKVSIAWVIREAAEQYVAAEWPLFASRLSREGK
jgi:metal-responsive CopG/Arc/MetJ family transcriptional regulator